MTENDNKTTFYLNRLISVGQDRLKLFITLII